MTGPHASQGLEFDGLSILVENTDPVDLTWLEEFVTPQFQPRRPSAGFLIAGASGAGKTSLLIHVLSAGNTDYLSNDRVLVSLGACPPQFRGMPTITALRSTTLDLFPQLKRSVERSRVRRWTRAL